jgi:hypothetical protein
LSVSNLAAAENRQLPPPVPQQYERLKTLWLDIDLVKGGQPQASIVVPATGVYDAAAATVQRAIAARTNVQVPIISADDPGAAVPIRGNLIVLGNRSTNKTISALYDLYYCLVDLKYPGPEGYVLRTVHSPFGDGHGVVVVGGSDTTGVEAGAKALADVLTQSPATNGGLSLGWTLRTKLGTGIVPPTDIREFETWEASQGYGSVGYFGWCSISKRMAMYYMTGDEFSAREVVRLSFPDDRAIRDIEEIDGERIENKRDPLAGFYHYNAHMAILLWDLIEESPVFSDDERLRITNAFARQLNHRRGEGVYGLTQPPQGISSRHGQWSAISLYCLGRYFQKDYPDPVWAQCVRAGELAFQSLHQHAWVTGESDNLFWYNTGIAPILSYLVLTGDRKPLANGVLPELLRGQEILSSGRSPDWALNSASLDLFHKAAYLTGDGRWLMYRERSGVNTNVFRLGQSFWPDETIAAEPPEDLVGKWSIQRLPKPAWAARGSGLPWEQSFYFGSYRSAADDTGDFILLDGFNGASRNPYHTCDILELRLNGNTILQGYHNQVQTSADGMVEPAVAMDAALLHSDVVGRTAIAIAEVPRAAFCNWRRTLCHRTGQYSLIVDDLTFRADSQNMAVKTTWESPHGRWDSQRRAVRCRIGDAAPGVECELRSCDDQEIAAGDVVSMTWHGPVRQGTHRIGFYLIGQAAAGSDNLACRRLAQNAAALAVPQPALAVIGDYARTAGQLVVLAADHIHGRALTGAGIDDVLVSSDVPVDIDWDFTSGVADVVCSAPTSLVLNLNEESAARIDGQLAPRASENGVCTFSLPAGRHRLDRVLPAGRDTVLTPDLRRLLSQAQTPLIGSGESPPSAPPSVPEWAIAWHGQLGDRTSALIAIPGPQGPQVCAASGNTVHIWTQEGQAVRTLTTKGNVRAVHWWDGRDLLLVGCADEKVLAFDADGNQRWSFSSEMDPAVYEAAKTYWFKSAPGHEGIHGLSSGEFDGGQSRCFVGSACTLEILDEAGQLVKRVPVFWGPCWKFLLVNGPASSRNLLIAQWPNGNDSLAIVNSTLSSEARHGFDGVPAGHSFVSGWTAQNRTGLCCRDLDGDGAKEVVTAVNGTWNRVTVYSEDGRPQHNAQFGPGPGNSPREYLRDFDVADLNADGKHELLVAVASGLVVALSHDCQKLWSVRLSSPPVSVRCCTLDGGRKTVVVAGCEDGSVSVLDDQGRQCGRGQVTGRPTHMLLSDEAGVSQVVFATDRGDVCCIRAPQGN